jgi:hypothetical protein
MEKYNRKTYKSRGKLPQRDILKEIVDSGRCEICGKPKVRKEYPFSSIKLESLTRFRERRTCGRVLVGDKFVDSECSLALRKGETNSNFKNGKCIVGFHKCSNCNKPLPLNSVRRGTLCQVCSLKERALGIENCSVDGCNNKFVARVDGKGFCKKHYSYYNKIKKRCLKNY